MFAVLVVALSSKAAACCTNEDFLMEFSERQLILKAFKEAREMPESIYGNKPGYPYFFESGKNSAFGPYQIQYGLMEDVQKDINGLSEASGVDVPDGFEDYLSRLIRDSKNKRNLSLGRDFYEGEKLDPEVYGPLKLGTISREEHEKYYETLAHLALQQKMLYIPEGEEINIYNIAMRWHGNENPDKNRAYAKDVSAKHEELKAAMPVEADTVLEEPALATPPGQGGTTVPFIPDYLYGLPPEQYAQLEPNEQESIKSFAATASDEERKNVINAAQRLASTREVVGKYGASISPNVAQANIDAARHLTAGMMFRDNGDDMAALSDENARRVFLSGQESTITDPILAKRRGKKAKEGAMLLAGNFRQNDAASILMTDQMQAKSSQRLASTPSYDRSMQAMAVTPLYDRLPSAKPSDTMPTIYEAATTSFNRAPSTSTIFQAPPTSTIFQAPPTAPPSPEDFIENEDLITPGIV